MVRDLGIAKQIGDSDLFTDLGTSSPQPPNPSPNISLKPCVALLILSCLC